MEGGTYMEREACIRCGGTMGHIGQEKLQLGRFGLLVGHWDQLISGALTVDIYCCHDCKKLEFYAIEAPDENAGGTMAQVPCPGCGQLHELDDPKCPHCGKRLLE